MEYRIVDRDFFLTQVARARLRPYHEDLAEFTGESFEAIQAKAGQAVALEHATWRHLVAAPTATDHAAYYGATASYLYKHVSADRERYSRYKLFLAPYLRGRRFLDFGCGVGCLSLWCARLHECAIVAADLPSRHLDFARFRFAKYTVPVTAVTPAAGSPYPTLTGAFDTIFSLSTFEHLLAWQGYLAFFRRHLAAGGRVILKIDYDHRASPEHLTDLTGLTRQTLAEEAERVGLARSMEEPIGSRGDSVLHILDAVKD